MIFKSIASVIKQLIYSTQHRQLYALKSAIKILKWIINYFDYKGDIMINKHGSFVGTDGVYLTTKATKRYLKSNNTKKINQGFLLYERIQKLGTINVIFDIGANVGEISIYFSKMYPNSKVFAFEPSKRNLKLFNENIKNQFFNCDNITIIEKAVSNYNGKIKLTTSLNAQNTSIIDPKINREIKKGDLEYIDRVEEVDVITLENLCNQNQIKEIDFVKIDIEGAEPLLTDSIINLKPRVIFMEISSKNTEDAFIEMLKKLSEIYKIHDNNFKIINNYKLFISNLFSNPTSYYKVSCTDVWLVKKK